MLVVLLAVVSVGLSVLGPKILGHATDIIFSGVIGRPAAGRRSTLQQDAALDARLHGNDNFADMLLPHERRARPGRRLHRARARAPVRDGALRRRLRRSPGCRAICSPTPYRARCTSSAPTSRTRSTGCRSSTSTSSPAGETLSRVTNDIDNIQTSLQQTMSQLLTSLLTIVGVVAMMFWISPLLVADRARHDPVVDPRDAPDRQAVAEAVHRPVDPHGRPQRADRGGVHRATTW